MNHVFGIGQGGCVRLIIDIALPHYQIMKQLEAGQPEDRGCELPTEPVVHGPKR